MQNLKFATHHARTAAHAGFGADIITQFVERDIGLLFHGIPDESLTGFQSTMGTAGVRLGGEVSCFAPPPPPIFDRSQTDAKVLRNLGLRKFAVLNRGNHTFTQIK